MNLDSDKIKLIMREIDNQILFEVQDRSFKMNINGTKIVGLVLMFGGGFITVFTYLECGSWRYLFDCVWTNYKWFFIVSAISS